MSVSRETLAGLLRASLVSMSYSIIVKATGGELTVTSSGQVPDGEHMISGHEDATQVNVGVTRKDVDGKSVIQGSAWRPNGS